MKNLSLKMTTEKDNEFKTKQSPTTLRVETKQSPSETKEKNPKRVLAGIKSAEARKAKIEQKNKEYEQMEKENMKLKLKSTQPNKLSITKDDSDDEQPDGRVHSACSVNVYKNYLPLCLIGVIGLGIYIYKSKPGTFGPSVQDEKPLIQRQPAIQKQPIKKEIDPFEFN